MLAVSQPQACIRAYYHQGLPKQTHNLKITSSTSHRRRYDVVLTSCGCFHPYHKLHVSNLHSTSTRTSSTLYQRITHVTAHRHNSFAYISDGSLYDPINKFVILVLITFTLVHHYTQTQKQRAGFVNLGYRSRKKWRKVGVVNQ